MNRVHLAVALLALVAACKSKQPDRAATPGSGSAGSATVVASGSGSGSGSASAPAPAPPPAPVDDGKPPAVRTRELLVKQVDLVKAGNSADLRAMFEPDAVILAPEPTAMSDSLDLAARFAATPKPADLAIGDVAFGDLHGAIWIQAELTYGGGKQKTRIVELLDGAKGWKIATASIATPKQPTAPAGDPAAMPSPTEAGPLAKLLGAPHDLAGSLLDSDPDDADAPDIFAVGWEPADRGVGYVNAQLLAFNLGKKGVTADARVKPHEIKTAAWSYALEILDVGTGANAPRVSGLAIAVPDKKDPTKWVTVAAAYNAL